MQGDQLIDHPMNDMQAYQVQQLRKAQYRNRQMHGQLPVLMFLLPMEAGTCSIADPAILQLHRNCKFWFVSGGRLIHCYEPSLIPVMN